MAMGRNREAMVALLATAALAVLPQVLPRFYVILLGSILIYGLFAMSFNILFGYAGLLSFGQAGFFAAGAYAAAYVLRHMPSSGFSMYLAVLFALALSLALSLVIGLVCVRLSGWVFAMVTLAFGQVIYTVVYKWRDVTGGDDGLYGISVPKLALPGGAIDLSAGSNHFYFLLLVVAASVIAMRMIVRSPFGSTIQAIRDNPTRAQFIGLNVRNYRLGAFVLSGVFAGLAGALFSPFKGIASPELANWASSANPVIMSLIGGTGYFLGPLVGALVYRLLEHVIAMYTSYWMLFFGIVLTASVLSFRSGITPYLARGAARLRGASRGEAGAAR
jgi:branched-chain amino acid transport system permease protein